MGTFQESAERKQAAPHQKYFAATGGECFSPEEARPTEELPLRSSWGTGRRGVREKPRGPGEAGGWTGRSGRASAGDGSLPSGLPTSLPPPQSSAGIGHCTQSSEWPRFPRQQPIGCRSAGRPAGEGSGLKAGRGRLSWQPGPAQPHSPG